MNKLQNICVAVQSVQKQRKQSITMHKNITGILVKNRTKANTNLLDRYTEDIHFRNQFEERIQFYNLAYNVQLLGNSLGYCIR